MRAGEFDQPLAAGCILYAEDTGRWGFQQRSDTVTDPGVWSTWGGGRQKGETLAQCVRRELAEEGGYLGPLKLELLDNNGHYATFVGLVPQEFKPQLNSEAKSWCWVDAGDWPHPLHDQLKPLLAHINEAINTDIVKSGWSAEKTLTLPKLGDIKLQARNINAKQPPQFMVDVFDDHDRHLGYFRFVVMDWEPAPKFRIFSRFSKQSDPYVIGGNVSVDSRYQRRGIARAVYQWVRSLGNDIRPSTIQTPAGQAMWQSFKDNPIDENFADGRNPGRKGLSRRVGIPKKATLGQLEKIARNSTGERRRMAQWQLNMLRGRKK